MTRYIHDLLHFTLKTNQIKIIEELNVNVLNLIFTQAQKQKFTLIEIQEIYNSTFKDHLKSITEIWEFMKKKFGDKLKKYYDSNSVSNSKSQLSVYFFICSCLEILGKQMDSKEVLKNHPNIRSEIYSFTPRFKKLIEFLEIQEQGKKIDQTKIQELINDWHKILIKFQVMEIVEFPDFNSVNLFFKKSNKRITFGDLKTENFVETIYIPVLNAIRRRNKEEAKQKNLFVGFFPTFFKFLSELMVERLDFQRGLFHGKRKYVTNNIETFLNTVVKYDKQRIQFLNETHLKDIRVLCLEHLFNFTFVKDISEGLKKALKKGIDNTLTKCELNTLEENDNNLISLMLVKFFEENTKLLNQNFTIDTIQNHSNEKDSSKLLNHLGIQFKEPINIQQIVNLIEIRKKIIENEEEEEKDLRDIIKKFKISIKDDWVLFLLHNIYNKGGVTSINNFLTKISKKRKTKEHDIQQFQKIFSKIPKAIEFTKETPILEYITNKKIDESTNISHLITNLQFLPYIESKLEEIQKKVQSDKLFQVIIHSIEIFEQHKIEPLFSLFPIIMENDPEKRIEKTEKLYFYFPTTPSIPFENEFIKDINNWIICQKKHLNYYSKKSKLKECSICKAPLSVRTVDINFFTNPPYLVFDSNLPKSIFYTVRGLNPITFRILRLFFYSILFGFACGTPSFSLVFLMLINDSFSHPYSQEQILNLFHEHIQNDFFALSKLLETTFENSVLYFHLIFQEISKELKNKKSRLSKLNTFKTFEKPESRNKFENKIQEFWQKSHTRIIKLIKQKSFKKCNLLDEIQKNYFQKKWYLVQFESQTTFLSIYNQITQENKFTRFLFENLDDIELINLFPSFLLFVNSLFKFWNGKLSKDEVENISIKFFVGKLSDKNQERNWMEVYKKFEKFFNICLKQTKYLILKNGLPRDLESFTINKNKSIEYCIPGEIDDEKKCFIKIMIEHISNLNRNLIEKASKLTKSKDEKKKKFVVKLPDLDEKIDKLRLFKIEISEIEELFEKEIIFKSTPNEIENRVKNILTNILTNSKNFTFRINNFVFSDTKIDFKEFNLEIINSNQSSLSELKWNQIWKELEANSKTRNFLFIIDHIIENLNQNSDTYFSNEFFEKTLYQFVSQDLQIQEIEEIAKISPTLKKEVKLTHILFIKDKFKQNFDEPLKLIAQCYQAPLNIHLKKELDNFATKIGQLSDSFINFWLNFIL
ncbi:hypothetical protein M0811_08284 [Anaeramoeba ignava]|uniref:Uncharacterized protein n=1 Tax=Anaeramoeba ignava TaxID=1746090 RepID=A0A9Q0LJM9_ANAIG|nr:hypothetical protein M0811_08284 [Anaeramoeba ignava]